MTLKPSRTTTIAAGLALALSGVGAPAVLAQEPVQFRIGITQAPTDTGLNPYIAYGAADYALMTDVYDLLVEWGPDLQPVPGLAERWETSEDGLTRTFHIRPGVTWHDGTPFTAEDVRFHLQYIIDSHDPAYVGPQAPDGNDLYDAEGNEASDGEADNPLSAFDGYLDLDAGLSETRLVSVEAPDELTLVIRTSEPIATLEQMYVPILPKHVWQDITFEQAAAENISVEQVVGTGPFRLTTWDREQVVILEANETFWGGRPHIDELIYQYFDNDEAQVNALVNGDVDFLDNFPPGLIGILEATPGVSLQISPSSDFGELGFNSWDPTPERFVEEGCPDCAAGPTTGSLGDPWITRPEVRAALAGLVDKQELIDFALGGYATPGVSVVSPADPDFAYIPDPDSPATFPAYEDEAGQAAARTAAEERFRATMTGLGFADTDGNGILNVPDTDDARAFDPDGAGGDWSLRLFVRDEDEEDKLAGQLIETWFESAGVDVAYEPVPEDRLYEVTYPSTTNADMDMYIWGWGPDPDPDFILSIFVCSQINSWQDANYCDPEYDEMYRLQRVQADPEERARIVRDMQAKVYAESPYVVLWNIDTLEAYRSDRFEGFSPTRGTLWSTYGFGPWGSRVTVGPLGAAGEPPELPSAEG